MLEGFAGRFKDVTILLVEDDRGVSALMNVLIRDEIGSGISITTAGTLAQAIAENNNKRHCVVLLDLNLPDSRGMDTLKEFRRCFPETPVIVLTALADQDFALSIANEGAQDYLIKGDAQPSVIVRAMYYAIERNRIYLDLKKNKEDLQRSNTKLRTIADGFIQAIEKIVETRDPYTAGHMRRVAGIARAIAIRMDIANDRVTGLYMAAMIHDVGKIYVPAEILSKPGKMSDFEMNLIKMHPEVGHEILKSIDFPWDIDRIVFQHHERENGSGYPQGLKADQITEESAIISIADVVEAMASARPYRPALGIDAALEEIEKNKGILYRTAPAEVCLKMFRDKSYSIEKI
jgi:HD-GYP domain-containing protein (c-di-GMP phosphodiesterase class II)